MSGSVIGKLLVAEADIHTETRSAIGKMEENELTKRRVNKVDRLLVGRKSAFQDTSGASMLLRIRRICRVLIEVSKTLEILLGICGVFWPFHISLSAQMRRDVRLARYVFGTFEGVGPQG